MLSDEEIHRLLSEFGPAILKVLRANRFFDLEGPYDPAEVVQEITTSPAYREYKAESQKKNSKIWDIVKAVIIGQAIRAGIDSFHKDYSKIIPPSAKYAPKPTAQDYMNRYIKEHGGEFITRMGRTDQQLLTKSIWANAGMNERPLAKLINQQPHLKYILDQGNHRVETIVRTEKFRATSYGTFNSARDSGFKTKAAIRSGKKNSRAAHRARSGIYVPIDEPLPDGEMYPGSNSINCQCRLVFGLDSAKATKNYSNVYKSNLKAAEDEIKAERKAEREKAAEKRAKKAKNA